MVSVAFMSITVMSESSTAMPGIIRFTWCERNPPYTAKTEVCAERSGSVMSEEHDKCPVAQELFNVRIELVPLLLLVLVAEHDDVLALDLLNGEVVHELLRSIVGDLIFG